MAERTDRGGRRSGLPASVEPLRERVDGALREVVAQRLEGAPAGAADAIRYAALGPGKRIRPILAVAGFRAAGGGDPSPGVYRLACSVELVHAYSLIHDDLPCMDDDDLRRGRPALHVRAGEGAAVFTGAVLFPMAVRTITEAARGLGLEAGRTRRLVAVLTRATGATGMVGGQLRDLEAEGRRPDRGTLEAIYRGKTAALIAVSAAVGGIAARAPTEHVERLRGYGERVGLAFQVVDDVLDVTATDRELGKRSGRDADLEKATYPGLFGLEEARVRARGLAADAIERLEGLPDTRRLRDVARYVVERGR